MSVILPQLQFNATWVRHFSEKMCLPVWSQSCYLCYFIYARTTSFVRWSCTVHHTLNYCVQLLVAEGIFIAPTKNFQKNILFVMSSWPPQVTECLQRTEFTRTRHHQAFCSVDSKKMESPQTNVGTLLRITESCCQLHVSADENFFWMWNLRFLWRRNKKIDSALYIILYYNIVVWFVLVCVVLHANCICTDCSYRMKLLQ